MADDTDVAPIDETSEMLDMADAFLFDGFVSKEASIEDVPVSPYGFGPYPEVPADYPEHLTPIWARDPNAAKPYSNPPQTQLNRSYILITGTGNTRQPIKEVTPERRIRC